MTGLVLRVPRSRIDANIASMVIKPFINGMALEGIYQIEGKAQKSLVGQNDYYYFYRVEGRYIIKGNRITIYD